MENKSLKVIIFGATGLAGSGVLNECLKHPQVEKVTIITRGDSGIKHEKLVEIIHDNFLDYSSIKQKLAGYDACFWCLGVSQVKVRDKNKYREISLNYTLEAAKVLTEMNKEISFCFLTGVGTDPTMKSKQMWARIKGEAEKRLEDFPFKYLYIYRPGYIHPIGGIKHSLFLGRIVGLLYPVFNKLFPSFVTTTEEFGLAMINAVLNDSNKKIYENKDIRKIAKFEYLGEKMLKIKWDSNNIADQSGKVVIVTGSSSGIGYETAKVLANKNAEVIIAVRNQEKGQAALNKIKAQYNNANVLVVILDLADLESVKKFADEFINKYDRLDLLINNAGVMIPPYSKTKDGFELQMGTNHLGHFVLTGLLLELLNKIPNSRVVNVSSMAHKYGNINFEDLNWGKRKYSPWKAYGDSKIANLYFTYELQKRLISHGSSIRVAAAHPGWTATDLQRHSGLFSFMNPIFAQGIDMGALPTLYAAVADDVKGGDYYGPSGWQEWKGYPKKTNSNSLSKDQKIAEKLWAVSEELTGVKFKF